MVSIITNGDEWQSNKDYAVYNKPLEKPANDEREYRLLRLSNQLEVLIVSDAETDRASAALDVHVGSSSDPVSWLNMYIFRKWMTDPFLGRKIYKDWPIFASIFCLWEPKSIQRKMITTVIFLSIQVNWR
jgi:insulysin